MDQPCRIRFVGTGTAFNTDGRGSQAIWLDRPGRGSVLLDFGQDVMRSLAEQSLDCERLDTLFVTHHHGDHIAGWPFLMLHWVFRVTRSRPLQVVGPNGTRDRLDGLTALAYREILSRRSFDVQHVELDHGVESSGTTDCGIRYTAIPMQHHPSSLGYRLEFNGHRIAVTGDTAWCDDLPRLVSGCDVAIVECTGVDSAPGSHLSLSEIRAGIDQLDAKRLVLTHLTDAVADSIAQDPLPRTVAAYDGLVFDL